MIVSNQGGRRCAWATLLLFSLLALCGSSAFTLAAAQDTSLEDFEDVDPYTKGERKALDRVGYVSLGPFHWAGDHTTLDVVEALGGTEVIFIETAHFKLASTLESYKQTGDRIEKDLLEDEFAALKKKLPRAKLQQEIDPWLRAHLYAYRLEQLYTQFCRQFGVTDEDFRDHERKAEAGRIVGQGPYLGQKDKFTVLLTQSRSAFGRYIRHFLKLENEYSYRFAFPDCYFFGANAEALKDGERKLDIALYTSLAGALAQNFLDGFRSSNQVVPPWFSYGLAHWYARRIDGRWNQWGAGGTVDPEDEKDWVWEPRVWGLVKNEASTSWTDMMGWKSFEDMKAREHMLAWSRVDWILKDRATDAPRFLWALTEPIAFTTLEERPAQIRAQEQRAYQELWNETPEQLDEAWTKWVLKNYPRK